MNTLPAVKSNSLPALVNQFRAHPLLSREEEHNLAMKFREHGDPWAKERLINSNLRNVVCIAMDYAKCGLPIEDLIQEGSIGLMQGVVRYDPQRGPRLWTYAIWWVKAYINSHIIKNHSLVKCGTTELQKKLIHAHQRLLQDENLMGSSFSEQVEVISEKLNANAGKVTEALSWVIGQDLSLDKKLSDHDDTTFLDCLKDTLANPEETVMKHRDSIRLIEKVNSAIEKLSQREQDIARRRFMSDNPETLESIGLAYNISKERVRQIENKIKEKLKGALQEDYLLAA